MLLEDLQACPIDVIKLIVVIYLMRMILICNVLLGIILI